MYSLRYVDQKITLLKLTGTQWVVLALSAVGLAFGTNVFVGLICVLPVWVFLALVGGMQRHHLVTLLMFPFMPKRFGITIDRNGLMLISRLGKVRKKLDKEKSERVGLKRN
jgi:hypothetical protein